MVLLFFMDGVKFDMMKEYMPFLSSMNSMPLQSEFGYSCACHATMYTSRYVDEHKTWFIWKRGEHSPYKWINYVPGLKYLNFLPLKLIIGKVTNKFSKVTAYSGVPCLVNLPLKYWPLFELSENVMWNDPEWKKELPNLFTIMREHGVASRVVALHKGTRANDVFREEVQVDYANDQFVYFFIGYTDNMMHAHGEFGVDAQKYLTDVDTFIHQVCEKAKKLHDDVKIIAFSDHGHIDLEQPYVDINTFFKAADSNVNNYIHLIESNYARFWFRNEHERGIITEIIRKMQDDDMGFVLDESYQDQYHLNLDPKVHGELIFYLRAPYEFTKTIWGFGHTVKSGHGFEPTLPKHYGFFCSNKSLSNQREFARLTDILPSVMAQMDIPREGYLLRGQSLIDY